MGMEPNRTPSPGDLPAQWRDRAEFLSDFGDPNSARLWLLAAMELDQALQVHHHEPWSDWWLLEARNQIAGGGCALSTRRLYTRSGRLLASASSHALIATT